MNGHARATGGVSDSGNLDRMTGRRTVGVAVTAALFGAAAGYTVGRRHSRRVEPSPQPGKVIKVTRRQVQAPRVAIEARKLLGEAIPPGLRRIADAGRTSAEEEYRFYTRPENQVPQGRPRRRVASTSAGRIRDDET